MLFITEVTFHLPKTRVEKAYSRPPREREREKKEVDYKLLAQNLKRVKEWVHSDKHAQR